jgi:hypothetical protein
MFNRINNCDPQANAVRAYLTGFDGVEESWSNENKRYMAEPVVNPWFNGRECGYVITMRSQSHDRQINIAFFTHRNSDNICAIVWEQITMNPPTIATADFGGKIYKDKWDVSLSLGHGKADEMASFIMDELSKFWETTA